MTGHDIIGVGASAGGVEALIHLVSRLPVGLPASLFVVLHVREQSPTILPGILSRNGSLPAVVAAEGMQIEHGMVYVAPPGSHLLVDRERIHLSNGPTVNGFRPAIDPLFKSLAYAYGPRAIGVILSGTLDDGAIGLETIHRTGGLTLVQDPQEALFPSMPESAIKVSPVDFILPVDQISAKLVDLVSIPVASGTGKVPSNGINRDTLKIESDMRQFDEEDDAGSRSILSCPACGGVLWEIDDQGLIHYQCHVGHSFSPDALLEADSHEIEAAFWTALRALIEKAALSRRLAARARKNGRESLANYYLQTAQETEKQVETLRGVIRHGTQMPEEQISQDIGDQAKD